MKQLHFQRVARMHVAVEGPHRFVLHQIKNPWCAEIYEREGRRVPKLSGQFRSKAEAIDWMGRYRKTEAADAPRVLSDGTYVLVPTKNSINCIIGHAPLDLSHIREGEGNFAIYVDGLSADEAGALLRKLWGLKEARTAA